MIYDVTQMYYGAILATELKKLGQETRERFDVTLELTEQLYQTGTGTVKRTDFLRTSVIVSNIVAVLELLNSNEALTKSALVNAMGLENVEDELGSGSAI